MNHEHYLTKANDYFSGARKDWITDLPASEQSRILEIGCGNGDTGAMAKNEGKCAFYAAVELVEDMANEARKKLDDVICGNAETIDFPWPKKHFDVLLMSEVLEHLENPDLLLKKVAPYLADDALIMASSPNVSHHSIIKMLLEGEWRLADQGIMDRTHLRWFTPKSYKRLFEESGFEVIEIRPVSNFGRKSTIGNFVTGGRVNHIFWTQINLKARNVARENSSP